MSKISFPTFPLLFVVALVGKCLTFACKTSVFDLKFFSKSVNRRTGVLRPTQGPENIAVTSQRPRSKTNKLYYYQGYHDGSSKYKKKPPKGMYINHDDVLKLAAQDLNAKETPRKQPVSQNNDLLVETEREINVLHSQVRHLQWLWMTQFSLIIIFSSFFFHDRSQLP